MDRTSAPYNTTFFAIFRGFPPGTQIVLSSVEDSTGLVGSYATSTQGLTVFTTADPYYYGICFCTPAARPMHFGTATVNFIAAGVPYSVSIENR